MLKDLAIGLILIIVGILGLYSIYENEITTGKFENKTHTPRLFRGKIIIGSIGSILAGIIYFRRES